MINCTNDYLTGVIDSDGSLSISKRHTSRPNPNFIAMIQITWLYSEYSLEYFEFLKSNFGGSYFIGKSHSGFDNPKTIIKYCSTGKSAERILLSIKNKLVLKNEQCENLLYCIEINKTTKRKRSITSSKNLERLYKENKELNGTR